jgi:aryl-alcohol dehydrogenase-like predicted oxidoreductase
MKYRRLGTDGPEVSAVGVGTWQFGGEWGRDYTPDEAEAVLKTARDEGINLVDTAECYGDHLSEELVGYSIAGERDQWFVATKFGHKYHGLFDRTWHWTPDEVRTQLEDSLRALRTDHVDLYQFHSGDDDALATDGLWEMLAKQVEAGKIRYLGISISAGADMDVQVKRVTEIGGSVIQVIYNRLDRAPEATVFPFCRENDIGVLARVPLASGLLSGKYGPGATFPDNDVRGRWDHDKREGQLREVGKIAAEEVPPGMSMAQWALAWCLKEPAVTTVIPGCKNPEQVRSNARAADLNL